MSKVQNKWGIKNGLSFDTIFTVDAYPDRATRLPKMKYYTVMFDHRGKEDTIFYLGCDKDVRDGRGFVIKYLDTTSWHWHKTTPDTSYYWIASNKKEGDHIVVTVIGASSNVL